jgi:hypothetical protein
VRVYWIEWKMVLTPPVTRCRVSSVCVPVVSSVWSCVVCQCVRCTYNCSLAGVVGVPLPGRVRAANRAFTLNPAYAGRPHATLHAA